MIRSIKALTNFQVISRDGETGDVDTFLFDDGAWMVRYLVVRTGGWLARRLVLISPQALEVPEWESKRLPVRLSHEQIRHSPDITTDEPVSRREAYRLHRYYGWNDPTWFAYGPHFAPPMAPEGTEPVRTETPREPQLRSTREVIGYRLQATDGEIGHLEDLLVEEQNWSLRYLVVDTRNWWPGKIVLLSPAAVRRIGWAKHLVELDISREKVRHSPEYDPFAPLGREYESRLYDYYGWPKYWV